MFTDLFNSGTLNHVLNTDFVVEWLLSISFSGVGGFAGGFYCYCGAADAYVDGFYCGFGLLFPEPAFGFPA